MDRSATRVDQAGRPLPDTGLSEQAVDLYGQLAAGIQPEPGDTMALAELEVWGMAGRAEDGAVVPLPPTTAAWTIAQEALVHVAAQARQLMELPATIHELEKRFASTRFRAGTGSEFLADRNEVNARIGRILAGAQEELLGAHPHEPRTREQMRLGVPRDTAALERGVRYRTLYQDVVRDDAVSCEWASTMAPLGAQYRTLADPFERVIIVDRKVAVIANSPDVIPDAPEHAAWIITDRSMVDFCVRAFDKEWRRARPWFGERRVRGPQAGGGVLSDLQKAILTCLAEGQTQDGAARSLTLPKRSLQRQLDQVRAVWGMPNASIGQLTYHWALSPERDLGLEQAA